MNMYAYIIYFRKIEKKIILLKFISKGETLPTLHNQYIDGLANCIANTKYLATQVKMVEHMYH